MSTTVDQRVVEMRFDNRQFERNVATTMSSLEGLKQSLNFTGATKGLEGIGESVKKVDMSGLVNAAETVRVKFSAMEVVAIRALSNITDSAMRTGKQLISSLTVDQISAGWEKFGDKTQSVGTLISQGYDLDTVNAQLNRLNWFTDETSYNFTDMVSNIAKFTASGQDLETSVTALEGIANWAALSGQNAQTASHAMYQLSQAMGAGVMRKEDYKSIQNVSMDTDEFRQKALDAGVALGTLKKNADGTYRSLVAGKESFTKSQFAEHLTEDAWFTSDVMMRVFNDYSGAVDQIYEYAEEKGITASQAIEELGDEVDAFGLKAFKAAQEARTFPDVIDSVKDAVSTGWMNTFELIFGNYEEAKTLWTDLANAMYDVFAEGGNARNEMLGEAMASGWSKFTGAVKNSGIELSAFEDKLKETVDSAGLSFDDIIADAGSLENAVQQGLISTDILLKAVQSSAEGLSEEELAELNASVDELIGNVGQLGGRQHLINAFWNAWNGIGAVLGTVKEGFRDIFPATTAEQVYNFTKKLDELTERFRFFVTESEDGQQVMSNLKSTFKGFFAILDIVKQAVFAVGSALSPLLSKVGLLGGGILQLTGSFGDWLVNLDETVKTSNVFNEFCQRISSIVGLAISKVSTLFQVLQEKIKMPGMEVVEALLGRAYERMGQFLDGVASLGSGVDAAFSAIGSAVEKSKPLEAFQTLYRGAKTVIDGILDAVGNLAGGIAEKLSDTNFSTIIDLLNGVSLSAIALGIVNFLKVIQKPLSQGGSLLSKLKGILSGVQSVLNGALSCFEAYQEKLKAGTLLKIAGAIAILAASIVAISLIDSDKLTASLAAITALFADLVASMAVFTKLGGDVKRSGKNIAVMLAMSTSVLILASALKKIADLEPEQLAVGLTGVTALLGELTAVMKILGSGSNKAAKGAAQMILFAVAVRILAQGVKELSELNSEKLTNGLVGVGVLLAEVAGFLNVAKMSGKAISTATGVVILSGALKILASVCEDFGRMDSEQVERGLASIGVILLEMAAFTNLTANAKHVISTGFALIEIAAAMKIFASAMSDFNKLNGEQIQRGLAAVGGALVEVAIAMRLMPKNSVSLGVGLIAVGAALEIIADALSKMGDMTWEQVAIGLVAMGGALGELAIGLKAMTGSLAGSAALLVASGALAVLAPVLLVLGSMSWDAIAKGLLTLAGVFTVLGIAGAALAPLAPTILTLAGSIALLGLGTAAIGAGFLAVGAGFSAIAVGITALAVSLGGGVTIIVAGLTSIITGIAALIPAIATKIGEAIIAFCGIIADGAPAIGKAAKAVVLTLIDVLVECVPALAEGALALLDSVLSSLAEHTPSIVDSLFTFLIGLLNGVAEKMPELVAAGINVLVSFFAGIIDALREIDTDVLVDAIAGIGLVSAFILAMTALTPLLPSAMIGVLGLGALIAELALVLAAVGALAQIPGLDWLINEGATLLGSIGNAIGAFAGGVVGGFMGGVSSHFPQIGEDLSNFMTNAKPFIEGAQAIDGSLLDGVSALAEAVLILTGASVLNGIASWLTGGSSITAFAEDLTVLGPSMKAYADSVAGMDTAVVKNSAEAAKALSAFATNLPNTGGIVSWFTGDNDISTFGESLISFGEDFRSFYLAVGNIDTVKMDGVIHELNELIAMATGMASLNTWGMSSFGTALISLANSSIDGFVDAFANAKSTAVTTVGSFLLAVDTEIATKTTMLTSSMDALVVRMSTVITSKRHLFIDAGKNVMEGFKIGIERYSRNVTKAASTVATDAYKAAMDAIGAHSPATKFIEIGMYADQGLAKGLGDYAHTVTNACTALGDKLLRALQDKLGIHSPSKVMKDEVGRYIVQGIAEGITEDMSAEDAAAKKAQNIVNAFKTELDKFDLDATTAELEYELWSKLNGDTATDAEKASAELGLLSAKLQLKAEQVQLAQAEYQTTLDNLGSTAEETQSAYNKLLQAQIDMAELSSQLTEAQNDNAEQQREAYKAYIKLLGENRADLLASGFTQEEVESWARSESGYDPEAMTASMSEDVQNATTTAMATVQTAYAGAAESTFGSLLTSFSGWGASYAESLGVGIQNGESGVETALSTLVTNCTDSVKSTHPTWYETGSYLVDGLIEGIESKRTAAISAAAALASAISSTVQVKLDINSPSRVFESFGRYSVLGLANGLSKYTYLAERSASELADETSNGMSLVVGRIADALSEDFDMTPTIRPVVDLTNIEKGAKLTTEAFAIRPGLRVSGISARVSSIATERGSKSTPVDDASREKTPTTTSYNFTQNNYSPKALSRLEIYRQTKNQFSALKGAVK